VKILILTPEFAGFGGGIMTYYQQLAPALARAGCAVHVVQASIWSDGPPVAPADAPGVTVSGVGREPIRAAHEGLAHLAAVPTLRRHLAMASAAWQHARASLEFDVVEATDFGLLASGPALDGFPTIQQMHGSIGQIGRHDPQPDQLLDATLAHAMECDLVRIVTSQSPSLANARHWQRQTGTDVSVLHPAWTPPNTVPAPPSNRLAVFGRIQRWKGPHILCEALRAASARDMAVDWYGRDMPSGQLGVSTRAWLQASYPDVWGTKIIPHEPVPARQVAAIQAGALVNVVPSTWDVFNFTAVEALASGRPTVCSDAAGASELIEHGVSGYIYRADDPGSLARALDEAMSLSSAQARQMGEAARQVIFERLAPGAVAVQRLHRYALEKATGSSPGRTSEWFTDLVRPVGAPRPGSDFLNQLPLRDLARHVGRRVMGRIARRPS
jgi:glycosyltransferase involved in cell wall biosynthesis